MGYESSLHLIDVKIKPKSLCVVKRILKSHKGRGLSALRFFFERAVLNTDDFLAFEASEDGHDPYVPDEEGTVPALFGKWYEAESIAEWLKHHSEKGGRVVLHSIEADGEAWGWEFDGRGKMRPLSLSPIGNWR